jgi:WXG100 family type VII secretion target
VILDDIQHHNHQGESMTTHQMSDQDQAIAASARVTRQARLDLAGQIDSLNHNLAGIGSHWQGSGAAAFGRVTTAWHDRVTRLLGALDQFADNLDGIDRSFQATNDDAARSLDLLTSRLG